MRRALATTPPEQKKGFQGKKSKKRRVLTGGIEPSTLGLLDPRSDQLSYASVKTSGARTSS